MAMTKRTIRKAVIPAAGLGTRFLPATKAQPKEMLPIVDKPAIQYIVEEAIASGIEDIIIVTGKGKRAIEDHFDRAFELETALRQAKRFELLETVTSIAEMLDITYVRQKTQLGLGHAVWCARKFMGSDPFAVLLGDDIVVSETPCLAQLIDCYTKNECSILGVQEVPDERIPRYGIVNPSDYLGNRCWTIKDLCEKPNIDEAPSNMAIMGRYILTNAVFEQLEGMPIDNNAEMQLTDAIAGLLATERIVAYLFEGQRYDIGDKLGFLQATVDFALTRKDIGGAFSSWLEGRVKEGVLP